MQGSDYRTKNIRLNKNTFPKYHLLLKNKLFYKQVPSEMGHDGIQGIVPINCNNSFVVYD